MSSTTLLFEAGNSSVSAGKTIGIWWRKYSFGRTGQHWQGIHFSRYDLTIYHDFFKNAWIFRQYSGGILVL